MKLKNFLFLLLFSFISLAVFSEFPEDDVGKEKPTVCLSDLHSNIQASMPDLDVEDKIPLSNVSMSNDIALNDIVSVNHSEYSNSTTAIVYQKPFVKYNYNTF